MPDPGFAGFAGGATSRWEERRGSNEAWAVRALTTCNAVGPLGVLSLRIGFLIGRIKPVVVLYSGRTFPALRFIHFASWSLLARLPGPDGERLKTPYLLFLTNFNGDFEQYIDAFSYVIGAKISNIWRFSYGFPGPTPSEPFKAFIERQELVSLHYHSAYPGETTATILSALRVQQQMDRLLGATVDVSPETFAARYRHFLTDVQADL
jgi:hypothetical protein